MRFRFSMPALCFLCWSVAAPLTFASGNSPNLLPNASFELGLGQGLPTHWADPLNDFTFNLAAKKQPLSVPAIIEAAGVPHGRCAARLQVSPDGPQHLTSAVISLEGARGYVLSTYARSDTPGARLGLRFWTRPLNWENEPDVVSPEFELTNQWKRYEFRFIAGYRAGPGAARGVVDLMAQSSAEANVFIDAVQLEAASLISSFQLRRVVEADLSAEGKPANGMVHTDQGPVTLDVKLFNDSQETRQGDLELVFTNQDGDEVLTQPLLDPIPPGLSQQKCDVNFGLVGRYQANCRIRGGATIDVADYLFVVRPLIDVDQQSIVFSVAGKAGTLPADRIDIPWDNEYSWYAEPAQHLVVGDDDSIFLFAPDGDILCTRDGGRTWDPSYVPGSGFTVVPGSPSKIIEDGHKWDVIARAMAHMTVMPDGSFLCIPGDDSRNVGLVKKSLDQGRTWEDIGEIPDYRQPHVGPPLELKDGTLIVPVGMPRKGFLHSVFAYRSTDQGKTWENYPIAPGGEPFMRQLRSGRLVALVRYNVYPPRDRTDLFLNNKWNWMFWQRAYGKRNYESYCKNLAMLESDDGGITWKNAREVTRMLGTMHGTVVELNDDRLVLIHCSRAPSKFGGERARVSRDGGNTWQPENYYLHTTPTYPGYSASCVLPPHLADGKPGMILTIVGNRSEGNWYQSKPDRMTPPSMQAIRWRPLP